MATDKSTLYPLLVQTMMGVTLAGLAEGMALADRAGLQQKDVLEVLELTGLACPILLNKGKSIIDGGFPTHQPLQHMQKDLKLSLNMGDTLEQPLPLTASANEVSLLRILQLFSPIFFADFSYFLGDLRGEIIFPKSAQNRV